MFRDRLNQIIQQQQSMVCVGLDTDPAKIPPILLSGKEPLLSFNKEIIQATADLVAAYKINIAFYEVLGTAGWNLLEQTLNLIPDHVPVIADAKRGDIGNSSEKYARTFFETFAFDAVTVAPYMGTDSIRPFLEYHDKGIFVLCLTSNSGARDFQYLESGGKPLFIKVAEKAGGWDREFQNCGLVVGATHPEEIGRIRATVPDLPFLIPGIGVQGGDLAAVLRYGRNSRGTGLLIHSSRGIIYASAEKDFAEVARRKTEELQTAIQRFSG